MDIWSSTERWVPDVCKQFMAIILKSGQLWFTEKACLQISFFYSGVQIYYLGEELLKLEQ